MTVNADQLDAMPDAESPVETVFWRRASLVLAWIGIGGMLVTRGKTA